MKLASQTIVIGAPVADKKIALYPLKSLFLRIEKNPLIAAGFLY